jgi:23S rRNA (pseudouridine1915-N3)-methyltransferase
MNILIAAIGRAKPGPERDLYQSYIGRLPWRVDLKEIEIKKESVTATRQALEGTALLAAVPAQAKIVVLDERGKAETSAKFASRLGGWRDGGVRNVAFLIGGADGHGDAVRARGDALLNFGIVTWPHMLVRAMLAEQLYRAHSILTGHPYHRG